MQIATILFTYNRSYHTKQVLEGINNNTEKPDKLYIFQDGLKSENHRNEWEKVKDIIRDVDFCKCEVLEYVENKGLANSIIDGINYALVDNDAVIVLEDDCVPTRSFFVFMRQALEMYRDEKQVFTVSGYAWPLKNEYKDTNDAYFNRRISSWGWGTWKDRWSTYTTDNELATRIMKDKSKSVELATWGKDLMIMLQERINGKNNSWAVYWALKVIEEGGVCLNPYRSLIKNVGFDGSGVHCRDNSIINDNCDDTLYESFDLPEVIKIRSDIEKNFMEEYRSCLLESINDNEKDKIVIYGLGHKFYEYEKFLSEKYNIVSLCDMNISGFYAGYEIIKLDQIKKIDFDEIIITIENSNIQKKIIQSMTSTYGIGYDKIKRLSDIL